MLFSLTVAAQGAFSVVDFDARDCVGVEVELRLFERTPQRVQRVQRGDRLFERGSVEHARLQSRALEAPHANCQRIGGEIREP